MRGRTWTATLPEISHEEIKAELRRKNGLPSTWFECHLDDDGKAGRIMLPALREGGTFRVLEAA